jgi:hypothetical protein
MRNGSADHYMSDLESQLEREFREFEEGKTHEFHWTDDSDTARTTTFKVNEAARTASIIPPVTWSEKDEQDNLQEKSGKQSDFRNVTRNSTGTQVQGSTSGFTVTFNVVLASADSKLTTSYKKPRMGIPPFVRVEEQFKATEEEAMNMIEFVKGLQIPIVEGELSMRELDDEFMGEDEEFMDEDERETYDDELDLELDDELDELDDEVRFDFEASVEDEEDDPDVMNGFVRRLHEISELELESEVEVENALDGALQGMEEEYFVRRVKRRRKRGKGKKVFGNILRAGANVLGKVAKTLPISSIVKAGTSLVKGDVRATLKNLGKAAVGTVGTALLGPAGGALATTAVDALGGGDEGEARRRKRRAIRRVAGISRDAYRELADDLPENIDNPYVAHEVAHRAVRRAMVKNGVGPRGAVAVRPKERARSGAGRVVRLRRGETLIIKG